MTPNIDISFDQLLRYFEERGAKLECASCGSADWAALGPPGETAAVPVVSIRILPYFHMGEPEQEGQGGPVTSKVRPGARSFDPLSDSISTEDVPVLFLICRHCNFIRFHSALGIQKHLASAQEPLEDAP